MPTSSELFLAEYRYLANYTCASTDVSLCDEQDESNGSSWNADNPFKFELPRALLYALGAAAIAVPAGVMLFKRNKTKVEVA